MNKNPLLNNFSLPPFSAIRVEDYIPAVKEGISKALAEVDDIVNNPEPPTFENTIEALERTGADLDRVLGVFYPLLSADADEQMMEASLEISALTSDFSTRISLNRPLFERVKAVYESKPELDTEQFTLLE
ncbi:MAG: peptidase M3, partial [Muribaculaceae bacterium]|nr:peptidase M3 [Muribaculaceae bacterium]